MKRRGFISFLVMLFFVPVLVTFSGDMNGYCLEIKSGAFNEGETIPMLYTGRGEDISPPLEWKDVPEGTKSFVLIMDDPDAPMGTWIHWVIYNIPANAVGLSGDIPKKLVLSDGTRQGLNSFRWAGYGGPNPPPGPAHSYMFNLYALDIVLDVAPGATKGAVVRAMQGHIKATARLTGKFGR